LKRTNDNIKYDNIPRYSVYKKIKDA